MKVRTTIKTIKSFPRTASIPYCSAQYLLNFESPTYYTAGIYGWNFDTYVIDGVTVSTGYRYMPGQRLKGVAEAEQSAERIYCDPSIDWDTKRKQIRALLSALIEKNFN